MLMNSSGVATVTVTLRVDGVFILLSNCPQMG